MRSLTLAVLLLAGCSATAPVPAERPELALFTSLPIVMNETDGVADMLASPGPPHWAKVLLEERYQLEPLDALEPAPGAKLMIMAQPRALAPQENVALDNWVRGGGRLLLLADPMLTFDSRFAIGDRRRPQDVALLSPILARWGLELRFDEDQPAGEHDQGGIPVNLPGSLETRAGGFEARCTIADQGLTATCDVGKGHVLIVADAALLEPEDDGNGRDVALEVLLARAFPG
jgi:hypothetical protein